MLVLTRNPVGSPGHTFDPRRADLVIYTPSGERIVVSVVESDRGKVRLATKAPKGFIIYRGEIEPDAAVENVTAEVR